MANEEKKGTSVAVKTTIKIVTGIILLAAGAWLIQLWRWDVATVIKGFLGMAIVLVGIIFLAIAKE